MQTKTIRLFCVRMISFASLLIFCAPVPANSQSHSYSYDAIGRLIHVAGPDGVSTQYNYDPAGNRTSIVSTEAIPDTTPDPISPVDQVQSVVAHESFTVGTSFQITGIDAPVTLRFTSALLSTSGNVSSRQMVIGRTTSSNIYAEWFTPAPGGEVDIVVNNGDTLIVKGFLGTSSGQASSYWRWMVNNQTNGGQQIGSATVNQTVDNGNNHNTDDTTPDPITPLPSVSGASNEPDATFGWEYRRITGISKPIVLRVERYDYSGDADLAQLIAVQSPDAQSWVNHGPVDARQSGYAYVDFTVNNGDYIGWKIRAATNSGRRTASMRVVVWNLSDPAGSVIISDTPTNIVVVDNDNNHNHNHNHNHNLPDTTPEPIAPVDQVQ